MASFKLLVKNNDPALVNNDTVIKFSPNDQIDKQIKDYFNDIDDKKLNFTATWEGLENLIFVNGTF